MQAAATFEQYLPKEAGDIFFNQQKKGQQCPRQSTNFFARYTPFLLLYLEVN
jgi:hypothetical protein